MHRARDELEHEEWLDVLESVGETLDLNAETRSQAKEIFLSAVPDTRRSKRAAAAAALYVAGILTGDRRSQETVADAVGVARLTVQKRWRDQMAAAGFEPPEW